MKSTVEIDSALPIAAIAIGRSLCFAPDWQCSDAAVLFDRNSGDYWVISACASAILKHLQTSGGAALSSLEQVLRVRMPEANWDEDMLATLKSLVDNRLVETSPRYFD